MGLHTRIFHQVKLLGCRDKHVERLLAHRLIMRSAPGVDESAQERGPILRMEDLEARLGPVRRDEARVRAAQLAALVKTRTVPAESKAPTSAQSSKRMI